MELVVAAVAVSNSFADGVTTFPRRLTTRLRAVESPEASSRWEPSPTWKLEGNTVHYDKYPNNFKSLEALGMNVSRGSVIPLHLLGGNGKHHCTIPYAYLALIK